MGGKNSGRKQKVTPMEILEEIKNSERITIRELAEIYEVCGVTVRNKLRTLRTDGESIIFDKDGLFYMNTISNSKDLELYKKYLLWVLKTTNGVILCGNNTSKLLIASKEYLRELTKEQRKTLMNWNTKINGLLNYISIEDEIS